MAADYCDKQLAEDSKYSAAWASAPSAFKKAAAALGMEVAPNCTEDLGVMEFDENASRVNHPGHTPSFHIPDMATQLDTFIDELVEKYGFQNERMVREIAEDLKVPMRLEIEQNRAFMLGRVASWVVKSANRNVLARVHQLMHAIPRLAAITGYASMRDSAKACGVTCEWIRRGRDEACEHLGLPIPTEGRKSDEARAKYQANGKKNHWRHQTFQPKPNLPICLPKRNNHRQLTRINRAKLALA